MGGCLFAATGLGLGRSGTALLSRYRERDHERLRSLDHTGNLRQREPIVVGFAVELQESASRILDGQLISEVRLPNGVRCFTAHRIVDA